MKLTYTPCRNKKFTALFTSVPSLLLQVAGLGAALMPASSAFAEVVEAHSAPQISLTPSQTETGRALTSTMYSGVILDNYKLRPVAFAAADRSQLASLANEDADLSRAVATLVQTLCLQQGRAESACQRGSQQAEQARVETLSDQEAMKEFSQWLFAVDGDNWFTLEAVQQATTPYFQPPHVVLKMIRGFNPDGVLVDLLSTQDLPVVINTQEGTLTLWTNELAD